MPPVKKVKPAQSVKKSPAKKKAVISGQLDKQIKKKEKKQEQKTRSERGVVFIKHLPHGFFEEQLKKYFEQFGNVTRLRLARSKRTGGGKGFAFVEFEYPEVAQVAAETMDNYLMFKKIVKASYIPPEKQHFNYFRTSVRKIKNKVGKEKYVSGKTAAIQRKVQQFNDWNDDAYQKRTQSKLKKVKKLNEKYAQLGIDFSKIVFEPKIIDTNEKAPVAKNTEVENETKTAKQKPKPTSKRKELSEVVTAEHNRKQKKTPKAAKLEDLLGNTINDDSEDEDYVAELDSDYDDDQDNSAETSDEETYGFQKSSDEDEDENDDDEDDDKAEQVKPTKKAISTLGKRIKQSNADRMEHLIKRKPHAGGIQKNSKKTQKKTVEAPKPKKSLQIAAAKAIAKPLPQLKSKTKPTLKSKSGKKVKISS